MTGLGPVLLALALSSAPAPPGADIHLGGGTAFNPGAARSTCLDCHALTAFRSGDAATIYIDAELYRRSIHGNLACVSCHKDAEPVPHPAKPSVVQCGACHNDGRRPPARFHSLLFLGSRLVPDAGMMRVVTPANAPRGIPDAACLKCHNGVRARRPSAIPAGTPHAGRACVDCHADAGLPHGGEAVPGAGNARDSGLAPVQCGRCHVDEGGAFAATIHGETGSGGAAAAPDCVTCHGSHEIRAAEDPASLVHPSRVAANCLTCHADPAFIRERGLGMTIHRDSYTASVHAQPVPDRGLAAAATCVDCHGAHTILPRRNPASASNFQRQAATCGRCHEKEAAEYLASAHGRAAVRGEHEAPACSDCHGEHAILSHTDPRSTTHRLAVAQSLCLGCHERLVLGVKYGLSGQVGKTYLDSYHGLATRARSTSAAVCTDCHGTHKILAQTDTASTIHLVNRRATCGRCHQDASDRFAAGTVHSAYKDHWLTNLIRIGYRILITGTLGGMFVWVSMLMLPAFRQRFEATREAGPLRFTRFESLQHLVLAVSFIALAVTGFALAFPDAGWARLLGAIGLTEEFRGLAHRGAGIALIAAGVVHGLWIARPGRGRRFLLRILPRRGDAVSALDHAAYALGRKAEHPHFGHFSYFEKMEYWALIWGTFVMAATGLVLWFPESLPRLVANVSEAIHFYEAVLAVGAILVWHMFFVFVDPDIYPLNTSIFTGRAAPGSDLARRTEENGDVRHEKAEPAASSSQSSPKADETGPPDTRGA
jgi:cytochrome b subunit of formate dehydrogenase